MESSDNPWDQICPQCGAKMHRQAEHCWLCGGHVDAPVTTLPARQPRYTTLTEILTGTTLVIAAAAMLGLLFVAGFAAFAAICTGISSIGPR